MEALAKAALDKHGRIDAIYNNAGVMPTANLSELHRDEWKMMLEINIMGVLNGIAAVLPTMKKQKSGHIIATDSVAGHVVYPGSAVYCGTKFAVRAIMEGLRQEERESNIRSTIISPGLVNTELYTTIADKEFGESLRKASEIPGVGLTPDDVAAAVAYALGTPDTVAISEILMRPTMQQV
ncbi:MAG: SDR family oxidoreductase [Candidatus Eisenbacteria bacterium]